MVKRLTAAATLWAGLLLLAFDITWGFDMLRRSPVVNDFRLVYVAAKLATSLGWPRVYDLEAQRRLAESLGFNWQPFITPPPLVWLALPFTALGFTAGLVLWTVLLAAALVAAWWLATGGRGLAAVAQLVLGAALFPAAFGLVIGQPPLLVGLAVTGSWWLARRRRDLEAGLCLALLCLKPQTALLVPVALLFAGRLRLVAACAAGLATVTAVSLALLGIDGTRAYLQALGDASNWELTRRYAISEYVDGVARIGVQLAVLAAVAAAGLRNRGRLEYAYAAGLTGSLLFTPYVGVQDFTLLVVAAWLVLRPPLAGWHAGLLALGVPIAELVLPLGPLPTLAWRAAWLISLAAAPERPDHDQQPEHQELDPQHRRQEQEKVLEVGEEVGDG